MREGEVGIGQPERGRSDLREPRLNQYCAGAGRTGCGGIARIRDKGDLAGGRLFNACYASDLGLAIRLVRSSSVLAADGSRVQDGLPSAR